MLSRTIRQDQKVYINNSQIVGIQEFNADYDSPIEIVKTLGMEAVSYYNNNNILAEISINKLLIDNDPFINFVDYDQVFSGHVEYKDKYFAFNSGILNNYRLNCSVNEIPRLSVTLNALGEFGSGVNKPNKDSLIKPNIDITDYADIEIDLDDFKFNRLQSIDLNINSEKNIIYTLGSSYPKEIKIIPPIVVDLQFTVKADDYNFKNTRDLICKYKVDSFSIKFNKFKDPSSELFNFTFNQAIFMGETFEGSVDSSANIIIKYQGLIYNERTMTHPPAMGGGGDAPPIVVPIVRPPVPLTTTTPPPDPLPNERFSPIIVSPPIVIIPPPPPPLGVPIFPLLTTTTTTTTTTTPAPCLSISKTFLEKHWWDECPVSTCGQPGVPGSCSLSTIGPINIYSDIFNNSCLKSIINPILVTVSYSFDNFGYVEGQDGSFGCPADNDCNICQGSITIIPFIEFVSLDQSRAYITAFAQNAFHGGPYSLQINATFNFS